MAVLELPPIRVRFMVRVRTIMDVLELPPSAAERSIVSFEFWYGT